MDFSFLLCATFWEAVGSIATAITLAFLVSQNKIARKTYEYTSEWQEKNKAAELALYYKDNILPKISYIDDVLENVGVNDLMKRVRHADIDCFTNMELKQLTNDDIVAQIVNKLRNDPEKMVIIWANRQDDPIPLKAYLTAREKIENAQQMEDKDEKRRMIREANEEIGNVKNTILKYFFRELGDLQNNLEYFAMHFTSGVADSSVVFPSLHQTYLEIVKKLYWSISMKNIESKDKYFTHIIQLYKEWIKQDNINNKKVQDAANKSLTQKKIRK